jgi:hypothetical protein
MVGEGILGWIRGVIAGSDRTNNVFSALEEAAQNGELDEAYAALPQEDQDNLIIKAHIPLWRIVNSMRKSDIVNPVDAMLTFALDKWIAHVGEYKLTKPEDAKQRLVDEMKFMIGLVAQMHAAQKLLSKVPWANSPALDETIKKSMTWLGFGAVLNAIAHDPVKIGMLRPWMQNLEATFRNRSLDQVSAIEAYIQRSLSESRVVDDPNIPVGGEMRDVDGKQVRFYDLAKMRDEDMDAIEVENDAMLDLTMAKYGTTPWGVSVIQDYATKSLSFGNLSQLARMGHHQRDIALFSLWGYGLDRRLMKRSLDALETIQNVSLWKGFRSMVEPGYVQGLIDADDMKEYWTHILVPQQVQDWAMVRLTKQREKFAAKEEKQQAALNKDLTQASYLKAYKMELISGPELKTKLKDMGYDDNEASLLVAIADKEKQPGTATACKKLPLSDYELAHRNNLLTIDQVLARMNGEYCQADIDLEGQLLQIYDLTSDAPAKERDLAAGTVTTAYVESVRTKDETTTYLGKLGYDDQEIATLMGIAEIKKEAYNARTARQGPGGSVQKERDLTLSQLTTAYVDNIIDEVTYNTDLGSLGYDAAETAILVKLAQIKKKIPSVTGLKRLPLGDYEKAWKYAGMTQDFVLNRMRGEYRDEDIQLEKMLLDVGKP